MAEIKWQDICKKVKCQNVSQKMIRQTVLAFYSAFETNTVPGCHIFIPKIGRFKGFESGVKHLEVLKRANHSKNKHKMKITKRRQREWARNKFDDNWKF